MSQKRLDDSIKFLESLDKFATDNEIKKSHFLYKFLINSIFSTNKIISSIDIKPNNVSTLTTLQKKYHRSLDAYIKTLHPSRYSLKRFIGKVWKKIRGNNNV
jgi:hypothetical protein